MTGSYYGGCAVFSTGKVDCWGDNLGNGTSSTSSVAVAVKNITNATAVSTDASSYCARLSTGRVDCWGPAGFDLGTGSNAPSKVPVAVKNITNAKTLTSNIDSSYCALLTTGRVDCWGNNSNGELGNGSTVANSNVPVAVKNITNATSVVSDVSGFCATLLTGGVDCWGDNTFGYLGNGSTVANSNVPVAVKNITNAKSVSSSNQAVCALLTTGHVDCWGDNSSGALGNGTTTSSNVPVAVLNITSAKAVSTTYGIGPDTGFCALLTTGSVTCWGDNSSGELGNGSAVAHSDVPVAVKNITNATSIGGAKVSDYYCATLSTGRIDCWGDNSSGELGSGSFVSSSNVPLVVKGITNAKSVAFEVSNAAAACSVLTAGGVDCWGTETGGLLGNGVSGPNLWAYAPVAVR